MEETTQPSSSGLSVARYKTGPFWAVWDEGGRLVCVCVYKKGAHAVVERLARLAKLALPPVPDPDPFWDPNLAAALAPATRGRPPAKLQP
jgi:hypothetical protein